MILSRLQRARRMTFEESRWRTRELAHTVADRVRSRLSTPDWDRKDIAAVLAPSALDDALRRAIERRDWRTVNEGLAERFTQRQSRCVIDPSMADSVRKQVLTRWPEAAGDASMRADRILAGHYDLLGYRGLNFCSSSSRGPRRQEPDVDWHFDPVHHRHAPRGCWADVPYLDPAIGDHKIIWELNRHQHWLQLGRASWLTGQAQYAHAIVDQMESWIDANPPLTGINWSSMLEIGFRTISWTMAIHFLLAGSGQQAAGSKGQALAASSQLPAASFIDALIAIDRQLTHVEHHLSYYFSPNTHLTGEALALYVVGQAFPELAACDRWVATGRRTLLLEIDRQILADGGHAERSTHYQRYTLDFYLLALMTARRAGDVDAARAFAGAATRLADFMRVIADDEGRLPLIGDDDGGMLWPLAGRECNDVRDSLAVAAVALDRPDLAPWGIPEEAFWIAAPEAMQFAKHANPIGCTPHDPMVGDAARTLLGPRSQTLADTGYVVIRDAKGGHAVFDTGAHGYMNGGHAHADALSLTLSVGHRPFLVDPGTSTYTMDPRLRDRMRGSLNHNTVSIDGRPQSTPAGPFHWQTTATGRLLASRCIAGFDWVEAVHDGYAPIEHRRSIVRAQDAGWLVVDELLATAALAAAGEQRGVHSAAAHWHFHPGWMLHAAATGRLHATHLDGDEAWFLFDAGELTLFHGHDESGLGWYAPVYGTLVPTWTARITHTRRLPFSMITWTGDVNGARGETPCLERFAVNADPTGNAIAARVVSGAFTSTYLVRPGEAPSRDGRACGTLDYQTNARALHYRTRGDSLVALDLADASHALALRDGWVSVAASEPIRDLTVMLGDGGLRLDASEPPRQLRLQGSAIIGLRAIHLNGRSYPPPLADRPDTLLISGSDWSSPLVHLGAPFALEVVRPDGCEEISPLRESSW
jgi:hypothetical protein